MRASRSSSVDFGETAADVDPSESSPTFSECVAPKDEVNLNKCRLTAKGRALHRREPNNGRDDRGQDGTTTKTFSGGKFNLVNLNLH